MCAPLAAKLIGRLRDQTDPGYGIAREVLWGCSYEEAVASFDPGETANPDEPEEHGFGFRGTDVQRGAYLDRRDPVMLGDECHRPVVGRIDREPLHPSVGEGVEDLAASNARVLSVVSPRKKMAEP
jgi:hypothetical protein